MTASASAVAHSTVRNARYIVSVKVSDDPYVSTVSTQAITKRNKGSRCKGKVIAAKMESRVVISARIVR